MQTIEITDCLILGGPDCWQRVFTHLQKAPELGSLHLDQLFGWYGDRCEVAVIPSRDDAKDDSGDDSKDDQPKLMSSRQMKLQDKADVMAELSFLARTALSCEVDD